LRGLILTFFGFLYDFQRFCRFGGWRASPNDSAKRNYKAVKVYHCLEKSLSFRDKKQGFGWDAVTRLVRLLRRIKSDESVGFQDALIESPDVSQTSLLAGLEWLHKNEQELCDQLTLRLVVVKKQIDYAMKKVREFV